MINAIAAFNHALHIVSAVIWIGGLAFVVMALNPSLRQKFPKESRDHLAKMLQAKYFRLAGSALVLIVITGALNVHFIREETLAGGGFTKIWLAVLGIKLFLATGLISVYLLNLLYRNEPRDPEQTEIPWARPAFILGVLTIISAAVLRHTH